MSDTPKYISKEAERFSEMVKERNQKRQYETLKKMCEVDVLELTDMPVFLNLIACLINDDDIKEKLAQCSIALATINHIQLKNKYKNENESEIS